MPAREHIILLISDGAELASAAHREFDRREPRVRITSVTSMEGARRVLEGVAPTVILLDEPSLDGQGAGIFARAARLDASAAVLAECAPVVAIAMPARENDLASLVAAGAADFVPRSAGWVPAALKLLEQRLRKAHALGESVPRFDVPKKQGNDIMGDFGGILRHELNNPLTGILGNAELLLAEVRRKGGDRMPPSGQQRLETIAALAVRLRETVRRLSEEWETQHQTAPPRTDAREAEF
jgi:signal transduction histidine kinase